MLTIKWKNDKMVGPIKIGLNWMNKMLMEFFKFVFHQKIKMIKLAIIIVGILLHFLTIQIEGSVDIEPVLNGLDPNSNKLIIKYYFLYRTK